MQLSPKEMERQKAAQDKVKKAGEVFRELLEVGSVSKASFIGGGAAKTTTIQLETSHRSVSLLTKRTGTQTLVLSSDSTVLSTSPLSFTSPEVQHTARAANGRVAVFRSIAPKDGQERKLLVEIWMDELKEMEVECTKEHGDWYFDSTFGSPTWSPDSLSLLYTAEPLAPKDSDAEKTPNHDKFKYTPDFGELFTGKKCPSIFLLTLPRSPFHLELSTTKPSIHRLTSPEDIKNVAFGQPIFVPSNPSHLSTPRVIATGYESLGDDRKLGIVYCANRPASIYELEMQVAEASPSKEDAPKSFEKRGWKARAAVAQSPPDLSCRSPRLILPPPSSSLSTPSFAPLLVFLSNPRGGPHSSCASLHAVLLGKGQSTVLVPTVDVPDPKKDDGFPGLYVDQLPKECLLVKEGAPYIVMSSIWRSRRVPLVVSLKNGQIESLASWPKGSEDPVLPYLDAKKEDLMSYGVLGTDGGSKVVATRSGATCPADVVMLDFATKEQQWKIVKKPKLSTSVTESLTSLDWTVLPLPKFEPSEIIIVSPITIDPAAESSISLPPLLTIPHGGPHSTTTTDCSAQILAFAIAGYRVALINYPGSLGWGQSFVDALPPQLGTLEVDATLATSHYLNTLSLASRAKGSRLLMGGSHGGFIAAHLSGKYPDEYDACVMRNPVVDLPSMTAATDIPDWTYAEAVLPYSFKLPPAFISPSQHAHLHSLSPSSRVKDVKIPTLLMIGTDDRRVPPDQGRMWYHALKSNGGVAEMMTFKGNGHALDSLVETEIVVFEASLDWLARFTKF